MEELKLPNRLKIQLEDNTNLDRFNESFTFEKEWYGNEDDGQVISIENYFYLCRQAALAMGFAEKIVNEWFEC